MSMMRFVKVEIVFCRCIVFLPPEWTISKADDKTLLSSILRLPFPFTSIYCLDSLSLSTVTFIEEETGKKK
jgi:predicted deacetylase